MYIHVYNVRAVIVTCKCLHVNGKVVMGSKGALIGEWCGVEFGVDCFGPRVQTVGVRDPHRAGRYKVSLVEYSTFPGGLELSARCTGSSWSLGSRRLCSPGRSFQSVSLRFFRSGMFWSSVC